MIPATPGTPEFAITTVELPVPDRRAAPSVAVLILGVVNVVVALIVLGQWIIGRFRFLSLFEDFGIPLGTITIVALSGYLPGILVVMMGLALLGVVGQRQRPLEQGQVVPILLQVMILLGLIGVAAFMVIAMFRPLIQLMDGLS